jgi:hypothetical protein
MKILKSFDTKVDTEELIEAVNKYWEWNVVLIKKHWIKLIIPLLLVMVSLILLEVMLYVIYSHLYDEHKVIFRILAGIYVYTTFSWCVYAIFWIVANIVWQMRSPKKYIDNIWKAEKKQKWFERFLKRTFYTFTVHVIVLVFNATIPFIVIKSTWIWSIAVTVWALILDIIFLFILNRIIFRIINYEMSFNICTKDQFTAYKQDWFFRTNTMYITTSAIKVIQPAKKWIWWAIWQYWDLYIHTDWDLNAEWWKTLELSDIPDPNRLTKKINSIIEKARSERD